MSERVKSLSALKTRSQRAIESPHHAELVRFARSMAPSSAYNTAREMMFLRTGSMNLASKLAESCRFLAMIKRDYGEQAFEEVVSSGVSSCPRRKSTGKKGRKAMNEEAKTEVKTPLIPLERVSYRASLNGAFSRVKCVQQFKNDALEPVEAVYVFPMPEEATVTSCLMEIGDRRVEAELKEKQKAREEYDQAVAGGHHATLLEQERPNIFTMNVGGIEPGQNISVEIDYVQRIAWQANGARFVIPLVVAPRFIPGQPVGKKGGGWSPDTDQVPDASRITPAVAKEGVPYVGDISVMFSPGFRCRLSSPSHASVLDKLEPGQGDALELKTGDITTDRDFVLVYQSLSDVPEVALHKGQFKDESFLLASIVPPGQASVVGSDIVAVLDCSGSMTGAKIDGLKVIAKKVARNLKAQNVGHKLGILPFDDTPWPSYPVSEINEATEAFIDRLSAIGGTNLGSALTRAHQMLPDSGARPRVILLVTDGQTYSLQYQGKGVRIIVVGIDTAVNDEVIKNLALQTGGTYEFVYPGEDYDAVSGRITGYLSGPVLRNVSAEAESADVVGLCDVFKARPAVVSFRFKGEAGKARIKGFDSSNREISWDLDISLANECVFAAQIWARDFIRENQDEKVQIEASLRYGVISRHTSFVAVSLKEAPGKKPERVEIPVNLPAGWDFDAVFGAAVSGLVRTRGGMPRKMMSSKKGFIPLHGMLADRIDMTARESVLSSASLPSVPSRFRKDSPDIADRLIAVLVLISQDRDKAEKAFDQIRQDFTVETAKGLSQESRSMAYYFSLRLASYGLKLDNLVMTQLCRKPSQAGLCLAWYNLALKEEGRPHAAVSSQGDGAEYISWKFGANQKPQSGDWSIVP